MTRSLGSLLAEGVVDLGQLADALWLAQRLPGDVRLRPVAAQAPAVTSPPAMAAPAQPTQQPTRERREASRPGTELPADREPEERTRVEVVAPTSRPGAGGEPRIWSPGAPPLRGHMQLSRALRPVGWAMPRPDRLRIVEDATADRIAMTGQWVPVMEAELEPALDLVLVIDRDPRLRPWRELTRAFAGVIRSSGRLRNVTVWGIDGHELTPRLRRGGGSARGPRHLLDATGRSAMLVVSDFAGILWRKGGGLSCLQTWARRMPTTLVSLLPQRLWDRTVLGELSIVSLFATRRGQASAALACETSPTRGSVTVPTITIDARSLGAWAALIAGDARVRVPGLAALPDPSPETRAEAKARAVLRSEGIVEPGPEQLAELVRELRAHLADIAPATEPEALIERFRRSAPSVVRLAASLVCAPLRLDVMRLVQRSVAPSSGPLELAEVLGSGLFSLRPGSGARDDSVWFDVAPEVRPRLAELAPKRDSVGVLELVGRFVRDQLPGGYDFEAIMLDPDRETEAPPEELRPFAELYIQELERLGGRYRDQARRLKASHAQLRAPAGGVVAAFRHVWILVVGDGALTAAKRATAEAVGAALARAGFGLITGGWRGVDEVTARAFVAALGSDRAEVSRLVSVVGPSRSPRLSDGTIVRVDTIDDEYARPPELAFAAIVIGGRRGTRRAVEQARHQGLQILAFPGTGGVAHELLAAAGATRDDRVPSQIARGLIADLEAASSGLAFYECLGTRYEAIRRNYASGAARTALMTSLVDMTERRVRRRAEATATITGLYHTARDGNRVIALACCLGAASAAPIRVIADAIAVPRSPFEQWVAIHAALAVVSVGSPLAAEPCVAAVLAQLDAKDSLLNSPNDSSRRALVPRLMADFVRRLGVPAGAEYAARRWVEAGQLRGARRRVAVFGGDVEGASGELCRRLGERLAGRGWRLSAGYGANVGPVVVDAFLAAGGLPEDATLLFSGDHGGIEPTCRKLLEDADAAVFICGWKVSVVEYGIALAEGIPALGVGFSGGTAKLVFDQLRDRLVEQGVPAELLTMLERRRDPEVAAETIIRALQTLLARGPAQTERTALRDAGQIRRWLVEARHCEDHEIIDLVNILSTKSQRSWLVFLPGRVLGLIDDDETRAAGRMRAFDVPPQALRPVDTGTRAGAKSVGVLTMGAKRRWLYSIRLFPDPVALVDRVSNLLAISESPGGFDATDSDAVGSTEAAERYLRDVRKRTDYFANWLPHAPLAIGDVGVLRDGRFVRVTTLAAEGISFQKVESPGTRDLELLHDADLSSLPRGARYLGVHLRQPGAYVLHARDCRDVSIADKDQLGRDLLRALQNGAWRLEWHVIDELVQADALSVLIGVTRAELEVSAAQEFHQQPNLASADAELSVVHLVGSALSVLGVRGAVPLYRMSRLRRSFPFGPLWLAAAT